MQLTFFMNLKEKFHKYLPDIFDENKCWEWKGAINRGYGVICHNKKTLKAHKVDAILVTKKVNIMVHLN